VRCCGALTPSPRTARLSSGCVVDQPDALQAFGDMAKSAGAAKKKAKGASAGHLCHPVSWAPCTYVRVTGHRPYCSLLLLTPLGGSMPCQTEQDGSAST